MSNDGISVPYNHELKALEEVLAGVHRAGDFFVQGAVETPVPQLEVEGVGFISFPVPEIQVQQIIQQASRAPYGRGEATLLDESVRQTWQLAADKVRLGGKAWEQTFARILETVVQGLGCAEVEVSAELYKLLVYERGGFFASHRDTEKAGGMFGTLVVMLPSAFRGGELVIRHAGREVVADLSREEFSELGFAAFYADCEHEVRPVTEGHRVCLIYNLIQTAGGKPNQPPLSAPLYASEIDTAGRMLLDAFAPPTPPAKLAWLLEHQYSPAGLSFAGLKGADAARAKVLRAAAASADCAVHLGIVHIEEQGPAEPHYNDYAYRRRRRWRGYDEDESEGEASSGSYEIIEVSDGSRHIDQWVDGEDRPVAYGELPLEEGEVLPAGALDGEEPDEQRLTEATGNEGASFERSYHRVAVVIWPREQFVGVLIQAGVAAALPHLADRLRTRDPAAAGVARKIIEAWERPEGWSGHGRLANEPSRAEMLRLLVELADAALLKRFVTGVVTCEYDGDENEALATALQRLGPADAGKRLAAVVRENFAEFHAACVELANRLLHELGERLNDEWREALQEAGAAMVEALPSIPATVDPYATRNWQRARKVRPVDAGMLAGLLEFLRALGVDALRVDAAGRITEKAAVFDPGKVLVPALKLMKERERQGFVRDPAAGRLWVHAAEFLLARSETPPSPPTDWRQDVKIPCKCEDCLELQTFARDPVAKVARFRVRKDRRQHLHGQIEHHGLDMTHETERRGSPQTLVCTKTRRTYERQCEQHRMDCAAMNVLIAVMRPLPEGLAGLAARLTAAQERRSRT